MEPPEKGTRILMIDPPGVKDDLEYISGGLRQKVEATRCPDWLYTPLG